MERLAIIDLGTNTFNLLIVQRNDDTFKEIFVDRVGVGLGLGGINEKRIAPEAIERGLEALEEFKRICDEHKVERIMPFGTSAIRNAKNKVEFIEKVANRTGLHVKVISGEEEAGYIYKGVAQGIKTESPYLIMDIGGGSTEFIYANQEGVLKAKSFEIGAARIFQKFDFSDPLSNEDIAAIERYLGENTQPFFEEMHPEILVGASGSFETFYELITGNPYPQHTYVKPNKGHFDYFLDRIIKSTMAERELEDRIIPIRKKMAPIAAVKIRWIIRKLDIHNVMISPNALKEGVLHEM